ncbi:MAG: hypothetical protein ACREDV_05650 [Methylocella sp.]
MSNNREQIASQCRVVAHLARELAAVHDNYKKIVLTGRMDKCADQIGRRTASFMEQLGDKLNAMGAVTKDDSWTFSIFEKAQKLWPKQDELETVVPNV